MIFQTNGERIDSSIMVLVNTIYWSTVITIKLILASHQNKFKIKYILKLKNTNMLEENTRGYI